MMTLQGHVQNGVVVPDGDWGLPENTVVLLTPLGNRSLERKQRTELLAEVRRIATLPLEGGPEPFSGGDHDQALYGAS